MVRRRDIEGDKEVDLAALVDVLANMLFFLLATVTFLQLKTLNAAVPALSTSDSPPSEEKIVNVSVEVRRSGYVLKASGELPSGPFEEVDERIPRSGDKLDTKGLTKRLWEIKKVATDTKNITILPEQGIDFEDIVRTMDATREMPSILDSNKRVPLFTRPVLSDLSDEAEVETPAEGGEAGGEAGGETGGEEAAP